jgi:hypothetical protein
VRRGATGAEAVVSSTSISSSLLSVAFFAGAAFFGGAFVLPDAFRAVVVLEGAALEDDAAAVGFFSKKSVTEACAVGLPFFKGLMYASLSSSSLSGL